MRKESNSSYLLKAILYPFAILYDGVTLLRNHLYNIGIKKSIRFETVVINVGNLTVGGTGKTPHVEYLIQLLKNKFKLATLSRGYGRKTKGFLTANGNTTAREVGDEPMQFYSKFSKDVVVAVGEERILAIPQILLENPEVQVILLDDAFQHRKVTSDLNILLCDYNIPFYEDLLLPAGRLRESRKGAERADIVIVSKCPLNIKEQEKEEIRSQVKKYIEPGTPVFFTGLSYKSPKALFDSFSFSSNVLLASGIARSGALETFVRNNYNFYKHIKFKDHHTYSERDVKSVLDEFDNFETQEKSILITEKDMVKWKAFEHLLKGYPVFYLPIEIEFLEGKERFDQMIFDRINQKLKEVGE